MNHVNQLLRRLPAWSIYMGGVAWAALLFWQGLTGRLGVEPIQTLEHEYGICALILLVIGLSVSPLRRFTGLNLLKFRRAIGVTAFFFVLAHLLVWAVLDQGTLARIWADILKRPYITVGMLALVLAVPLAVTSNNASVRWLGRGWRKLHRLTYPVVLLAGVHFVMLRKGIQLEPVLYLMGITGLLLLRLRLPASRQRRA
ncbi:protein-methionine-sulfoxide reductase heme-binding subunit MsrQ [Thalassovita sp.]|jgi:sulfoxide reductase heme-binding subunit YedZ|uniref:protein-methionine-sulfoxide reductase heme-binding subunit MsrQ n=1 Tax=Thalassovita sp. TaxID=1979401 RepID=UPI003B5A496B